MYFTNIDLSSENFQVVLKEENQNLTNFVTAVDLYK